VVLAMMTMSALRGAGDTGWAEVSGSLLLRLGGAAVLLYLLMRYVLPDLVSRMALAGAAADLRHRLGHRAGRAGRLCRLQQGPAPSSPASRWPPRRTARQ